MFKFRLQRVLDVRAKRQELIEMEHSRKKAQVLRQEQFIQQLRQMREQQVQDLTQGQVEGEVKVDKIISIQTYIYFLEKRIREELKVLDDLRQELEEARERLVRAKKDKEVLVRLKEKQHEQYVEDQRFQEQRFLDDVGSARFVRSRLGLDIMDSSVKA